MKEGRITKQNRTVFQSRLIITVRFSSLTKPQHNIILNIHLYAVGAPPHLAPDAGKHVGPVNIRAVLIHRL